MERTRIIRQQCDIQDAIHNKEITRNLMMQAKYLTKNHKDAEDLLQTTREKARRYRKKFTNGTNIGSRLNTIMKNSFLDSCRKRQEQPEEKDFIERNTQHSKYNEAEGSITQQEIQSYMGSINSNFIQPFQYRIEGYSYKEIAEILSIPLGTVKGNIRKGRNKLQQILLAKDKDYEHRL